MPVTDYSFDEFDFGGARSTVPTVSLQSIGWSKPSPDGFRGDAFIDFEFEDDLTDSGLLGLDLSIIAGAVTYDTVNNMRVLRTTATDTIRRSGHDAVLEPYGSGSKTIVALIHIRQPPVGGQQAIIGALSTIVSAPDQTAQNAQWQVGTNPAGELGFFYERGDGNDITGAGNNFQILVDPTDGHGDWWLIVVSHDTVSETVEISVNGELLHSDSGFPPPDGGTDAIVRLWLTADIGSPTQSDGPEAFWARYFVTDEATPYTEVLAEYRRMRGL